MHNTPLEHRHLLPTNVGNAGRGVPRSRLLGLRAHLAGLEPGSRRVRPSSRILVPPLPAALPQERLHRRTGETRPATLRHECLTKPIKIWGAGEGWADLNLRLFHQPDGRAPRGWSTATVKFSRVPAEGPQVRCKKCARMYVC